MSLHVIVHSLKQVKRLAMRANGARISDIVGLTMINIVGSCNIRLHVALVGYLACFISTLIYDLILSRNQLKHCIIGILLINIIIIIIIIIIMM